LSQAVYGSYTHDVNMVGFNSFTREYVDGPTGYHKLLRVTCDIKARIIRSTQTAVFAELEVMRAAYSIGGQSFGFYDDYGNLLSWALDTSTAVGGVTVLKPVSHGDIKGSHGVNYLDCNVVLQADYLQPLGDGQYLTFQESVDFSGSGRPLKVKRVPAIGRPFKQQVSTASWFYATQSGSLTTTTPFPRPMAPLAPDLFDGDEGDQEIKGPYPITQRGQAVEWVVGWTYRYSSPDPILIQPNIR